MSRAMNISMPIADVTALCHKAGIGISDIETLPTGGTHLVCVTGDGAAEMRIKLKGRLIDGPVKRFSFYHLRQS